MPVILASSALFSQHPSQPIPDCLPCLIYGNKYRPIISISYLPLSRPLMPFTFPSLMVNFHSWSCLKDQQHFSSYFQNKHHHLFIFVLTHGILPSQLTKSPWSFHGSCRSASELTPGSLLKWAQSQATFILHLDDLSGLTAGFLVFSLGLIQSIISQSDLSYIQLRLFHSCWQP